MNHRWKQIVLAAFVAFAAAGASATDKPSQAAIASAHVLATQAGFEALDMGGNAFDAAVASSRTSAEVQQKVSAKYSDLQLPIILKLGADAAFSQ